MDPNAIKVIIDAVKDTFNNYIIPLLFVVATAVFMWGIIQYVIKYEEQAAQKRAKTIITLGIIGLTAATAVWAIVRILVAYFGVGGTGIPAPNPLTIP